MTAGLSPSIEERLPDPSTDAGKDLRHLVEIMIDEEAKCLFALSLASRDDVTWDKRTVARKLDDLIDRGVVEKDAHSSGYVYRLVERFDPTVPPKRRKVLDAVPAPIAPTRKPILEDRLERAESLVDYLEAMVRSVMHLKLVELLYSCGRWPGHFFSLALISTLLGVYAHQIPLINEVIPATAFFEGAGIWLVLGMLAMLGASLVMAMDTILLLVFGHPVLLDWD